MRAAAWFFETLPRTMLLILSVAGLIIGLGVHYLGRRLNTDDAGTYCPNGLRWEMPDDGACYRECAMAAASSASPDYSTEKCARNACIGYRKVCRS